MNVRAKGGRRVNNRKLIIFGLMALAAIYHFSRPTLEKWTGMSLPEISGRNSHSRNDHNRGNHNFPSPTADPDAGKAARAWLKDIGGNKFQSPAGLVYTGGREHRVDHVLLHCSDNTSKPTHGIFVGDAVTVMKMVDEAYELVKSGSSKVESSRSGDKMTHTASMGRVVGHTGGRKAQRDGKRELRKIKLVLADNRVITAFPK